MWLFTAQLLERGEDLGAAACADEDRAHQIGVHGHELCCDAGLSASGHATQDDRGHRRGAPEVEPGRDVGKYRGPPHEPGVGFPTEADLGQRTREQVVVLTEQDRFRFRRWEQPRRQGCGVARVQARKPARDEVQSRVRRGWDRLGFAQVEDATPQRFEALTGELSRSRALPASQEAAGGFGAAGEDFLAPGKRVFQQFEVGQEPLRVGHGDLGPAREPGYELGVGLTRGGEADLRLACLTDDPSTRPEGRLAGLAGGGPPFVESGEYVVLVELCRPPPTVAFDPVGLAVLDRDECGPLTLVEHDHIRGVLHDNSADIATGRQLLDQPQRDGVLFVLVPRFGLRPPVLQIHRHPPNLTEIDPLVGHAAKNSAGL